MQSFILRALRTQHRSRNFASRPSLGHFHLQGEALEDRRLLSVTPALLKDVGGVSSSDPRWFAEANGGLYFRANDGIHGDELWVTNGTEAGTRLVRDIVPGYGGSSIQRFWNLSGKLYFQAYVPDAGYELWTSDGTEEGTTRMFDLVPRPAGSQIDDLTLVGDTIFFTALDPVLGSGLWKSDGTEDGTIRVKNFSGPKPRSLTEMNGLLYFSAFSNTGGEEFWKSDGTEEGTTLVKDIYAGSGSSRPAYFINIGNTLYFSAEDAAGGKELWKSDGTTEGTTRVRDIYAGAADSDPNDLVELNGILYFAATTSTGRELFRSDGTAAGTRKVEDGVNTGSSGPSQLVVFDGRVFFEGYDAATGYELWRSDGTSAGTIRLTDINPGPAHTNIFDVTGFGDSVYFYVPGNGIWKSAGTPESTVQAMDVLSGVSGWTYLTQLGASLVFTSTDAAHGGELWISDGTEDGTQLLKNINNGFDQPSSPREFTQAGDRYYFVADTVGSGRQIFTSDGTTAETRMLKSLPSGANPSHLTNVNGTLYFTAYTETDTLNGISGSTETLWKSDGTEVGTVRVTDFWSNMTSPSLYGLFAVYDRLFFAATDSDSKTKLWTSDGTASGTAPLADVWPTTRLQLTDEPYSYRNALVVNDVLYFVTRSQQSSSIQELWRSDGTEQGTFKLLDLSGGGLSVRTDFNLTDVDGDVYFIRGESDGTAALWKTNGTVAGTAKIVGLPKYPNQMIAASGKAFILIAGNGGEENELWGSDGTALGTTLVQSFPADAFLSDLTSSGDKAYFTLRDAARVKTLWTSNGTPEGTVPLQVVTPLGRNLLAPYLTDVDGTLHFVVSDDEGGQTLWKTNGTLDSTLPVVALPVLPPTGVGNLKNLGGTLLFQLNDGVHGAEPWILPLELPLDPPGALHHVFYNQSAWDGNDAGIDALSDNAAIAIDKSPYLPGSGLATFSSVTSYTRGINGIMVDLPGNVSGISAADFVIRVGNDQSPDDWDLAPAPSAVTLIPGAGVGGTNRVTITWPSRSIVNTWLEVTVLANANTGLAAPSIAYWGNRVGDTGSFVTDHADAAQVYTGLGGGKSITDVRDYNRSKDVATTDAAAVYANLGSIVRLNIPIVGSFAPEVEFQMALIVESDASTSAIATSLAAPVQRSAGSTTAAERFALLALESRTAILTPERAAHWSGAKISDIVLLATACELDEAGENEDDLDDELLADLLPSS